MFGLWHWYGAVSMLVKRSVQGFSVLWSCSLLPLFRPFMTGCNKRGWGHVASQLASATLLPLCSSQSVHWSCLLVSEVDSFCTLWSESLPESSNVFSASRKHLFIIKNKIACSYVLMVVCILIALDHKFLPSHIFLNWKWISVLFISVHWCCAAVM